MHPLTILVVDDSVAMRAMITSALRESGVPVRCIEYAANGADGLSMLDGSDYDVVLLDLSMPIMRGDEMLARIRATPGMYDLPIVVISSEQSERRTRAVNSARAAFVAKPFLASDLERAIFAQLLQPR